MSLSAGTVSLAVKADTNGFGKRLGDQIRGESGGHLATAGKFLGGAMLGGVGMAMAGVGLVLKTGFDEAKDASAGMAQLAAGIKSTGNQAHVSVAGMEDLATSIQGMSGQTDDSIVASEQLLLTFTNIKNVGANKIFDQATLASANMAAKMGGDASSQAILLGKALNDPVKGISALTRVGVSFTQGQKDSIAAMVKAGDAAGAQKIILKELNTEFGGAAEAAGKSLPGQMAIAKRSFEDLSQGIVMSAMPALTTVLGGLNNFVKNVGAAFSKGGLSGVFTMVGDQIKAALPGIQAKLGEWGTAMWAWIQKAVPPMLAKLGELYIKLETWIWTVAYPAIVTKLIQWGKAFVEWIGPMIAPMLEKLGVLLGSLGTWLLNVGLPLVVTKLAQWGKAFIGWVLPMIPPFLLELGKLLGKLAWWIVSQALPAILIKLAEWTGAFLGWVGGAIAQLPGKLLGLLGVLIGWAATIPGKILSALGNLGSILYDAGKSILNGLWEGMKAKFEDVKNFVAGIGTWIADHKGPISYDRQLLVPHGNAIMAGLNEGITAGFVPVQSNVGSMAGRLSVGTMDFDPASARSLAASRGATSEDIAALGDRFGAELQRLARTQRDMQRQMAGGR